MAIDAITLQCFITTCETKNITRAATIIGRTQSAVSQQIKKLEEYLGIKLIQRGKNFSLTPNGEIFLSYARQIYTLQMEALDRLRNPELSGEISFGLPEDFANLYLTEILAQFTRIHPRILLKTECDLTLNLFEKFKNNHYDLVLIKMNQQQDFPNGVRVWSEPLKWVGNPKLLKQKSVLSLVLAPEPCVYRNAALQKLEKIKMPWRLAFSSNSYASNMAAVKAGMGISVIPGTFITDQLQELQSDLLPVLPDIHISLLKKKSDSLPVNSLEEFVLHKFNLRFT